MRRTYSTLLFLFPIALCMGCQSDEATPANSLTGKWIETTARKDTIEFKSDFLDLRSERDADNVPRYPNGLWTYRVSNDSIQVNYSLSSFFNRQQYVFQVNPISGTCTVGNFYKPATGQVTLQFERLN